MVIPTGSMVLALWMVCASLAFLRQSRSYLNGYCWESVLKLRFGCDYRRPVRYRASMFIKTVLEAAFGFPNILQISKAALNHVNNIEHVEKITRNVTFDFVAFTCRVASIRGMWCSSCCCTEKNRRSGTTWSKRDSGEWSNVTLIVHGFAVVFEALVYITQKLCKKISNNEKLPFSFLASFTSLVKCWKLFGVRSR